MSDERDPTRLEIQIHGMDFRLRAPVEDHDRLRRAARHVDNVLRELTVSQTTFDTSRLAIQAAFVIALDFMKLMDDVASRNGSSDDNRRRVDELLQRLDDSLRAL